MLERALKLQDTIRVYTTVCLVKTGERTDRAMRKLKHLTDTDWEELKCVADALQPFHVATKRLEGIATDGYGSLWQCLPVLEYLLGDMEKQIPQLGLNTPLQVAANNAWNKLKIYYELTDQSPYYVAAILLNPHYKWNYFEVHWRNRQTWIDGARKKMEKLWIQHVAACEKQAQEYTLPLPTAPPLYTYLRRTSKISIPLATS